MAERAMNEMDMTEVILTNLKMVLPVDWDKVCLRANIKHPVEEEEDTSKVEYWVAKKNRTTMIHCSNATSDNVSKEDIITACSLISEYLKEQSELDCTYTFIFNENGKNEVKYSYHNADGIVIL